MPKKSAATRSGAQRNKPRGQKNIELVRQSVKEKAPLEEKEVEIAVEAEGSDEVATTSASTVATLNAQSESAKKERVKDAIATAPKKNIIAQPAQSEETSSATSTAPKGSAAARLAARRQAAQKTQQRSAPALVTAEHYAYVRRELIIIAILAFVMFSVIIILHFVPGIGG
jgi:transglutaminase/protease-like cytokinesis protein 3